MAVAFDAAASAAPVANSGSISWNHTVGGGSDRIILVALASGSSTPLAGVVNPTADGVACTPLYFHTRDTTTGGVAFRLGVWYALAPASGSISVAHAEGSAVQYLVGGSASYSGVDQGSPIGDTDFADGGSSPGALSLAISSAIGGMVADFCVQQAQAARDLLAGSGQTERIDSTVVENSAAPWLKSSDEAGAATTTMTWANSTSFVGWTHFAAALNAAGAGGSVGRTNLLLMGVG